MEQLKQDKIVNSERIGSGFLKFRPNPFEINYVEQLKPLQTQQSTQIWHWDTVFRDKTGLKTGLLLNSCSRLL